MATLKSDIDRLDIDKLDITPADLSKLSNVVKYDVVKKTVYDELVLSNDSNKQNFAKNIEDVDKRDT